MAATTRKKAVKKKPAKKAAKKKAPAKKKATKKKANPKVPKMANPDELVVTMLKEGRPEKHPGGRPTKYDPKYCQEALDYFQNAEMFYETPITFYNKDGSVQKEIMDRKFNWPPSIEEFAERIGVCWKTLYNWEKQHPEFLQVLDKCRTIQRRWLKNIGLVGGYNSNITKLLLSSDHGVSEQKKLDVTSKDESIKTSFSDTPTNDLINIAAKLMTKLAGPSDDSNDTDTVS